MRKIRKYTSEQDFLEPGEEIYRRGLGKSCSLVKDLQKKIYIENIDLTNYPGLVAAWSAKGKTNEDEDRATLKDLTGNGHNITLNGFAFSEMSGYGGYNWNMNNWTNTAEAEINSSGTFAKITGYPPKRVVLEKYIGGPEMSVPYILKRLRVKLTISGIVDESKESLYFYYTNNSDQAEYIFITKSGEYQFGEVVINSVVGNGLYIGFVLNNNKNSEINNPNYSCTIELLPEYPNALVFDGVDDYGFNENMPIQTDYTVIIKRKIFNRPKTFSSIIAKRSEDEIGAFLFERKDGARSFGFSTVVDEIEKDISWQTTTSYNGQKITKGETSDVHAISLASYNTTSINGVSSMAFYSAYLFDRSLGEGEIKRFIQHYIDPEYELPGGDKPRMILDTGKLDKSEL